MDRGASSLAVVLSLAACGGGADATAPLACPTGQEAFRGACVDPARRYEPAQRVDQNNVVAYGDPLTELDLPPPPNSGFRIIVPPRTLTAGQEITTCISWPIPKITNHVIYGARLYTTPGLHHSNVIAKAIDPTLGPNPYPNCNPGASDPFSDIAEGVPDVLFANSTQIVGSETLAFPPGMGWHLDPTREISSSFHALNPTGHDLRVEVAYDFFTMPDSDLEHEVAPFLMEVNQFLIPPGATEPVGATCNTFGGEVVSMMPHTHQYSIGVTVDAITSGAPPRNVLTDGAYDPGSDIVAYDPPLSLDGVDALRFACTFHNTTDHDIVYGTGQNEMCIIFGYLTPVTDQFVAYSDDNGQPCTSYRIGSLK